jgi:hypothetical protein
MRLLTHAERPKEGKLAGSRTRGKVLRWAAAGLLALVLATTSQPGGTGTALASDPVIAAAGDIACDPANAAFRGGLGTANACHEKYTSDLLMNKGLAAVLDLGDNQYYCGGYQAFLRSYGLTWGRVKSITRPAIGNHEYLSSGGTGCGLNAAGYFRYFGAAAGPQGSGYYSFSIGAWHIIALNSNCSKVGGCSAGSPQYNWLRNDLATHRNKCVLAYWHHPLFSSGGYTYAGVRPFWNLLYAYHAEIVLNGHAHIYERFGPQDPNGAWANYGIREFIVGTGGANHTALTTVAKNSQARNDTTFGVLRLALHAASYNWVFVPEKGQAFTDRGYRLCY